MNKAQAYDYICNWAYHKNTIIQNSIEMNDRIGIKNDYTIGEKVLLIELAKIINDLEQIIEK